MTDIVHELETIVVNEEHTVCDTLFLKCYNMLGL